MDSDQQCNFPHVAEEVHDTRQGYEQQMLNPVLHPHLQYLYSTAQEKSAEEMQPQQEIPMGMIGPSRKDLNMLMGNFYVQDLNSNAADKQTETLLSKNQSEPFARGENQTVEHHEVSYQRINLKPPGLQTPVGQLMPGNIANPKQELQTEESIQNMTNSQLATSAQMESVPAFGLERSINLLLPSNANLVAEFTPLMQTRMFTQQIVDESKMGTRSSTSAPMSKQQSTRAGCEMPLLLFPRAYADLDQNVDPPVLDKSKSPGVEALQMQHAKTIHEATQLSASSLNEVWFGNPSLSQSVPLPQMQPRHSGFTKEQQHVLRAQILAFWHLKKGDMTLPLELLQAIAPPSQEAQMLQALLPVGMVIQDASGVINLDVEDHTRRLKSTEKDSLDVNLLTGLNNLEEKEFAGDEKEISSTNAMQVVTTGLKQSTSLVPPGEEKHQTTLFSATLRDGPEFGTQKDDMRTDISLDKGKAVATEVCLPEVMKVTKPLQVSNAPPYMDAEPTRKSHGPLFDISFFTSKHDTSGSTMTMNNNNNMTLAYDVKELLFDEGREVLNKKKAENIKKIGDILAVNVGRKKIKSDLVLRLQIEQKKLRLLDVQARLRDEIDHQLQEIMAMPVGKYKKFVRSCERQRTELNRKVQAFKKARREKHLESVIQWRKKLLEAHWAIRDARIARNKGVAKYHDRILREFSKGKDDHHNKRMEALKNNDVERYREMLLEQQSIPGDGAERYAVLSLFLTQTEEYLHKMCSKITDAKAQQDVEEAANNAARGQGLSEDVRAATACAGQEVMIRNKSSEISAPMHTSFFNKYYNHAHAVTERVFRQPAMLRGGILRDYQLVGLQWMLSLYNNRLNGILADEMGLGKTVQVMSLIAYLMEFKGNYGPHLIIVPNAVLVNWKSELHKWLPSVSCIFYVGGKDQRSRLFLQDVAALKFNVLVTTYEFIMYDRSKLSKVDWRYIIIDEAQRMKDRESVLARDLDRYRSQRRLLLTGTPLQNDLKELWSLLNLILPEVFDNHKAFHDWFSKPFQKEVKVEDDWLDIEKKVIIIHRLHQILEPFMLRRRVEDVEGSLPPKVSIILRCRMSPIQAAVYDWIKSTGTVRVDPECERLIAQRKPTYQPKVFKTLHNRCMELRKTCNHPLLTYPHINNFSEDFLVRSCGKLFVLDRILLKLQRTGHRVLLFSTMTKLLDILEEYLQWRKLVYRRIDGMTSLEERESAIVDFNSPDSECFIFLLSIRAAGRGLNLQSADTVIIYDPDPNPKNEEQAVARAHRIGQKREVRVIYLEAVVDKISSHEKEDKYRRGGSDDSEDDLEGKDLYMGSIESLIRNNIQQSKIEMADEVINAGRFDQRTTHEERRLTLESMLHEEDRYQETVHNVPSLQEVNRMIARGEEEVELFDQMDKEFDWVEEMTRCDEVFNWLCASTEEVNDTITSLSKKSCKEVLLGGNIGVDSNKMDSGISIEPTRTRGKKIPVYTEIDEDGGFSEASSEERSEYSGGVEEEIGELEGGFCGGVEAPSGNKAHSDNEPFVVDGHKDDILFNITREHRRLKEYTAPKNGKSNSSKPKRIPIPEKAHTSLGPSRGKCESGPSEDVVERSIERRDSKTVRGNDTSIGNKMSDAVQHKCKNALRKFKRKIEKEGSHVVPLLTEFWKSSEINEQKRGSGKIYQNIQKIDQRLEKSEYKGVMELISDVQLMLKSAVLFYELSHEVQTEARKVHELFFDILKLTFPKMDLEEARDAVSFTGPVTRSTAPSRHALTGQSKRQKQANEVDLGKGPPAKLLSCEPAITCEDIKTRNHVPRKGERLGNNINKDSEYYMMSGRLGNNINKDSEYYTMSGSGSTSLSSPVSIGHGSKSTVSGLISKEERSSLLTSQQQRRTDRPPQQVDNPGIVGWANSVKRKRTYSGKRLPRH